MALIEKRETGQGTRYRVRIRLRGHPPQMATFERLTDARKWAQITEGAIKDGRRFRNTEAKRKTVANMIDRYIEQILPLKPKSKDKQARQLEWWKDKIGDYFLADITPALIAEQRDDLLNKTVESRGSKKLSPSTVVRYMAALSHCFTIAVKEWDWLDDSPMRKVTKPKEARGRVRFLSDDERAELLKQCEASTNPYLHAVVVLALATGMRQGEIMRLTWDDIDLKRGRITLHETKNGERRVVPLVGHAKKVIQKLAKVRNVNTNLLFPASRPQPGESPKDIHYMPMFVRKAWYEALKKANIENFRFHDLRHSAASYLVMNGASLVEIADVLGHKTLAMVKRYFDSFSTRSVKLRICS